MVCPVCTGIDLKIVKRLGVETDYCPECRGVWLDRGELDKIIERSDTSQATSSYTQQQPSIPASSLSTMSSTMESRNMMAMAMARTDNTRRSYECKSCSIKIQQSKSNLEQW